MTSQNQIAPPLHSEKQALCPPFCPCYGSGIVTIDGSETAVSAGAAVFIPGDALHGIRNVSGTPLRFFYCFPADTFSEIVYRFPEAVSGS